jgi:hypothetical protein
MVPLADRVRETPLAPRFPEIRGLDLCPKPKVGVDVLPLIWKSGGLTAALEAQKTLETATGGGDAGADAGFSRRRYLDLPRSDRMQSLVAEVYRLLRVVALAGASPAGRLEERGGVLRLSLVTNPTVYSAKFRPGALELLASFVAYYLSWERGFYPRRHAEGILDAYYADAIAEIRSFHDEDAEVRVFRREFRMNRSIRYAVGNAAWESADGFVRFLPGERYADPVQFPIDFFFRFDGRLHIVPVERLEGWRLPEDELTQWRARQGEGS